MSMLLISQLLGLLPQVIAGVVGAVEAFSHGSDLLSRMVTEKRDPSPDEWTAWLDANAAAHASIQAG